MDVIAKNNAKARLIHFASSECARRAPTGAIDVEIGKINKGATMTPKVAAVATARCIGTDNEARIGTPNVPPTNARWRRDDTDNQSGG